MLAKVAICAAALLAADTTNEAPKKAEIELISIERNVILHTNAERKRHHFLVSAVLAVRREAGRGAYTSAGPGWQKRPANSGG